MRADRLGAPLTPEALTLLNRGLVAVSFNGRTELPGPGYATLSPGARNTNRNRKLPLAGAVPCNARMCPENVRKSKVSCFCTRIRTRAQFDLNIKGLRGLQLPNRGGRVLVA